MEQQTRKNQRLQGYDYRKSGMFFITICTKDKRELLGKIIVDSTQISRIELSEYGKMTKTEIENIPTHYEEVMLDRFVIMPNHLHLVLQIAANSLQKDLRPATTRLSMIIAMLKKKTNKAAGFNLWQRSFYDHIVRNDEDYRRIAQYIDTNPQKWAIDRFSVE